MQALHFHFEALAHAIQHGQWDSVQATIARLRSLPCRGSEEGMIRAKVSVAQGLYYLSRGAYLPATQSFLSVDPCLGDNFSEVLSAGDVAVCGSLCALASTINLSELQTQVLDRKSFRHYLELEPHIRRVITLFCASRFRQALDILEAHRAGFSSNMHLHPQLPTIYEHIHTKSIQLYITPFSRITFDALASIFDIAACDTQEQQEQSSPQQTIRTVSSDNDTAPSSTPATTTTTTTTELSPFVSRLVGLVEAGTLDALIDLEHNSLIPRPPKSREDIYRKTMGNLQQYSDEAHKQLLRLQMLWAKVSVPEPPPPQLKA